MLGDKMKIAQMHSVIFKGDAVSNVMRMIHTANQENGIESVMISESISEEYKDILPLALYDFVDASFTQKTRYGITRLLRTSNKYYFIKRTMSAFKHYKKGMAKKKINEADIRIWHGGSFYPLLYYFREQDILFFHGYTYSYVNGSPQLNTQHKINLWADLIDMQPFVITQSEFIKKSIEAFGFKVSAVLPLGHKYSLSYIEHEHTEPKLVAWGRYDINKGIPELVEAANSDNPFMLRVFGDNQQGIVHQKQYRLAIKNNTKGYAKLSGKVDDFEAELSNANIYICNSYHEGFNMPLIEAEAHSLPIIVRKGTAMQELCKDGYNGFLFDDINEVPDLAQKILADYPKFSHNAWQHSQGFTYEKFKERYLEILKEYRKKRTI